MGPFSIALVAIAARPKPFKTLFVVFGILKVAIAIAPLLLPLLTPLSITSLNSLIAANRGPMTRSALSILSFPFALALAAFVAFVASATLVAFVITVAFVALIIVALFTLIVALAVLAAALAVIITFAKR
ncbi:hypothetical protein MBM_08959 [Drepanopeziza brunnea f. sp. 'multigermtubi' MB_m1]|uniref:Uncharacterized protein n=1 Tax=Marssonina brunnea f. sp. multigermtubi (strain MB_m1) TaxID=1072389 RepID=K1W6U2_MARBU|nr:uncharacterized protein MBM_08959 [Drepanopeziza brunnea f. sp. 'multigermtubi' MB_m1]EKD12730.1 hypothetical protein MBM_08959 [Drepanopeziza brunnea f. sp. 'multigermtubi' MB_m1]